MDIYQQCPKCGAFSYGLSRYSNGHYCFPRQGGCGREFSNLILGIKNNGNEDIKHNIAKIVGNDLDKILHGKKQCLKSGPTVVAVPMSKSDNFWNDCEL